MTKIATAGVWSPADRPLYFLASYSRELEAASTVSQNLLIAVNHIRTEIDRRRLGAWLDGGKKVLMDSGVYVLAMDHATRHGLHHDTALALPPERIDGYAELLADYIAINSELDDRLWGYIELDFGGPEGKTATRAKLEAAGLRPIPVYHPFGDGWDYFDHLAQRYDRICLGNVVKARASDRTRLMATLAERCRAYPELWIHVLGLTPNEVAAAYPLGSADSSSWLSGVRWGGQMERAGGAALGPLPAGFRYAQGADPDSRSGYHTAYKVAAYGAYLNGLNWHEQVTEATQ